jgi:hypothetical protein
MVAVTSPERRETTMKARTRMIVQIAVVLALAVGGTSIAQAEPFIPGYTDFPNALRVADQQRAEFIPGYTDFPNALRLAPAGTIRTAPVQVVAPTASVASGFDWADAGIGAGVTAATLLLAGGLSVGLRRRNRLVAS